MLKLATFNEGSGSRYKAKVEVTLNRTHSRSLFNAVLLKFWKVYFAFVMVGFSFIVVIILMF